MQTGSWIISYDLVPYTLLPARAWLPTALLWLTMYPTVWTQRSSDSFSDFHFQVKHLH